MAISYFGTGGGATASNSNHIAISTPASIPAGAVMVAVIGGFSSAGTASASGWTQVATSNTGSGSVWFLSAVAAGGEDTQTFTIPAGSYVSGAILVFQGVDTSSSILAYGVNSNGGTQQMAWSSASVNNTDAAAAGVYQVACYGGSSGQNWTPPAGYTEVVDRYASSINHDASYKLNASTGSQSVTATAASNAGYGGTVFYFLRPAVVHTDAPATAASASATAHDATAALGALPAVAYADAFAWKALPPIDGTAAISAPEANADIAGSLTVSGGLSATAPEVEVEVVGSDQVEGICNAVAPNAEAALDSTATVSGTVGATAPGATVNLSGAYVSAQLAASAPEAVCSVSGLVLIPATGSLSAVAPGANVARLDATAPEATAYMRNTPPGRRIPIAPEDRTVKITSESRTVVE